MQQRFDLTAVHAANLKMLKEIDRICRKYRIRYFLDAGTLLGAIRHKGFIPWDDDVDIAMPRRDYERFLRIAKEELPAGIDLLRPEDFRGGTAFYDFTARIIYQNSRRYPDNEEMRFYEGKLNHLWIDIFTMDRIPDNPVLDRLSRLSQKIVYGLAMGHRRELDYSKYSAADRIRVKILAGIGKRIPMKMIFGLQRRAASFWNFRKNTRHLYFTNYAPDWMYCTAESSWFRESVDVPFEDTVLSAAAGYEPMLRQLYGDYRKLPPEEKRVPEHSDFTFWE